MIYICIAMTILDGKVVLAILCAVAVCGGEFSCHCDVSRVVNEVIRK
jgi:hypothetical protein